MTFVKEIPAFARKLDGHTTSVAGEVHHEDVANAGIRAWLVMRQLFWVKLAMSVHML